MKGRVNIVIFFVCMYVYNFGYGQTYVNRPLIFTSTGDSAKIENLYTPTDSTAGVNAKTVQENTFNYVTVTGTDTLFINHPLNFTHAVKGMVLYFKAVDNNTSNVTLSFDGVLYYPLVKKTNLPLTLGDIKTNQLIAVGFDGTAFQYLNYDKTTCPTGFIKVTNEYCIEPNESATTKVYWDAITDCYTKNARLCNWGEWHYACVSMGTSLSNMTNNWEYTDDAANEVNFVRIVGSGSCNAAGNQNIPVNTNKNFRCCYSLK